MILYLSRMKNTLRLEEAAMFGLSMVLFSQMDLAWWWYPALILLPDIGMLGYMFSTKVGAITYNVFHHKGLSVAVLILGWQIGDPWMTLGGIVLFGHASLDRMFGFGLKYPDSFKHTHLTV